MRVGQILEMPIDTTPRAAFPTFDAEPNVEELPTVPVVGTELAITNYAQTMDWMDAVVARRERVCLTAAAVHLVMVSEEDPETRSAVGQALAVPDGQPLVWAMRAL